MGILELLPLMIASVVASQYSVQVTGQATTELPVPPVASWTVRDPNGTVCMQIEMSGRYILTRYEDVSFDLTSSDRVVSDCTADSDRRIFEVYPDDSSDRYTILLGFRRFPEGDNTYGMLLLKIRYPKTDSITTTEGFDFMDSAADNYLEEFVPLGLAYTCSKPIQLSLAGNTIRMWNVHFQPFVENTDDGDFGPDAICTSDTLTTPDSGDGQMTSEGGTGRPPSAAGNSHETTSVSSTAKVTEGAASSLHLTTGVMFMCIFVAYIGCLK